MSTPPSEPRGLRISDADRQRAAERLQVAMAEGRITLAELDERLAVVYGARYEAELLPPLADLPALVRPAPPVPVAPAGPATVLRAGISGIKRTGQWSVPARLRVQSVLGTVLLDFSRAENPHPVVEIELDIAAGSAKLLLPDDATANVDGMVATLGEIKSRVPSQPRPGGSHFVVRGRCGLGSVVVRRRFHVAGHHF
jgi:hypothetical protein